MAAKLGRELICKGEVRPTDMVPVIALDRQGVRGCFPMIWGYSEKGIRGPLFNARSELVGEKPMFAEGWNKRRCIVPASHFFEWNAEKTKYTIRSNGTVLTWLAGIYRLEERDGLLFPAFTILTRTASGPMCTVHERMPVILPDGKLDDWLSQSADPSKTITYALDDLEIKEAEAG